MIPLISVVLPTHNPRPAGLRRTLAGLREQTLPAAQWETIVVDNASSPPLDAAAWKEFAPPNLRLVPEPTLGLTSARRCGLAAARAPICVLVDDDNVLAPDYLELTNRLFHAHPRVGALGGRVQPEFEQPPAPWQLEFLPLLALRDLGPEPQFARTLRAERARKNTYPPCAPIGAGMGLRREAVQDWLRRSPDSALSDRRGNELSSAGDNDLVFAVMAAGWEVAYFPELVLTHLIPATRLDARYLARLNRGIQRSWMQVLTKHDANPWAPVAPLTVPLRKIKAWFIYRAWSSPAAQIRWQGACGHFDGRRRKLLSE